MNIKVYRKDKPMKVLTIISISTAQEGHDLRRGIFAGHKCKIMYDTKPQFTGKMRNHSQLLSSRGGY